MICACRDFDYGLDITLHEIARIGNRYLEAGRRLDVQVKSTTLAVLHENHIGYDLDANAHELLRALNVDCPRILVLHVLPEDEAEWLRLSEEEMAIRRCAYWLNLQGRDPVPNVRSVRLEIPRQNLFSPDGLSEIMDRVRKGENP